MDAVFKASTKVRVTGRAIPDAAVFHPNDWQDIRLTRTADGIYILGNPNGAGPDRLWSLRVVQSDNQTENTAVVGAWATWSQLRVRRDVLVEKTNSHDTYFTSGKQAVRAGVRLATVWRRAAAFCTVTGIWPADRPPLNGVRASLIQRAPARRRLRPLRSRKDHPHGHHRRRSPAHPLQVARLARSGVGRRGARRSPTTAPSRPSPPASPTRPCRATSPPQLVGPPATSRRSR